MIVGGPNFAGGVCLRQLGHVPDEHSPAEFRSDFVTTNWTMVMAAGSSSTAERLRALESLFRIYWRPLYAYIRRAGYGVEDAQDLTQSFVSHLLSKGALSVADRERGRFRSFLLTALKHYLIDDVRRRSAAKRGGGQVMEPLGDDAEEQYQLELADSASPDVLYDRGWARAVLAEALARLRAEYTSSAHGPGFETLKDYIWGERSGVSCAEMGRELGGMTEEAVKKAVQRMRRRFGELLREQVGGTLSTPMDLDDELRYLLSLLSPRFCFAP